MRLLLTLSLVVLNTLSFAQEKSLQSELELDHFLFFVTDTSLESLLKTELNEAVLLATEHENQGTAGVYFLFYNTYIELLYLKDTSQARNNEKRFGSNYIKRWQHTATSSLGFGLNLIPFDTNQINFNFSKYSSIDAPPEEYYIMPDDNQNTDFPFAYISLPHRQYQRFDSLQEIDEKVEAFKRKDLKHYLSHKNGIMKLTRVQLQLPDLDMKSNLGLLDKCSNITLTKGKEQLLILTFDEGIQRKQLKYEGDFKLLIMY